MDFAGVYLKLAHASDRVDALKAILDALLDPDSDSGAGIEFGPDQGDNTWRAITHRPETFDSLACSVLIGEAVYQLRSTLDHLINGLIPKATRDSSFPCYCDETSYDANAARLMPGLPEPYLTFVRELQPFWQNPADPQANTLWNLNEWARLDRHRFLHIADIWIDDGTVRGVPDGRITIDESVAFPRVAGRRRSSRQRSDTPRSDRGRYGSANGSHRKARSGPDTDR